jgi:hypothetical protein
MTEIINRVSNSSLISFDLDELYFNQERKIFDLKDFLFQELVLREMEFRKSLVELNWEEYKDKAVAIVCSADAIVPTWAYLLVGSYLIKVTDNFVVGDLNVLEQFLIDKKISKLDLDLFRDKPVVIKGCTKFNIPFYAYGKLISMIQPVCKSLMFGEPCSTVPIFKKPKIN